MKTLVVGAGIAGLAVAARLRSAGLDVVVVERRRVGDEGYAIGLYPLGTGVVERLGARAALDARSLVVDRYRLADVVDRDIQSFDMSVLTAAVGPMRMVERAALLEVLERASGISVARGATVQCLTHEPSSIAVSLSDGSCTQFDAVIGCDGMGSATRERAFGPASGYDAGWELSTWWTPRAPSPPATVCEWWGPRCFAGVYPAPERAMWAVGGPTGLARSMSAREHLERQAPGLLRRVPALAGAAADAAAAYRWPMRDAGARTWTRGRLALCGDAAAGFLPTAGFGASIALWSAWVLTDELLRAGTGDVPAALERYERRCRPIAQRCQSDSRRLARVMFLRHAAFDRPRRAIARRVPAARVLRQIIDANRLPF